MSKKGLIISSITIVFLLLLFTFLIFIKSTTKNRNIEIQNPTTYPIKYPTPLPTTIPITISQEKQSQLLTLQPGSSTEQDIKNIYGSPIRTEKESDSTINYYILPETWREDKIYIKDNTLQYVIQEQISDNALYNDFVNNTHKQPDGTLYDLNELGGSTKWYIFSNDGIAFLAYYPSGYTLRILKFPPMTYQAFLTTIAPKFKLEETESEHTHAH